jgi:hypothetical protein
MIERVGRGRGFTLCPAGEWRACPLTGIWGDYPEWILRLEVAPIV